MNLTSGFLRFMFDGFHWHILFEGGAPLILDPCFFHYLLAIWVITVK